MTNKDLRDGIKTSLGIAEYALQFKDWYSMRTVLLQALQAIDTLEESEKFLDNVKTLTAK
jgi:hypothetical protein